jgi:hypothetical protein
MVESRVHRLGPSVETERSRYCGRGRRCTVCGIGRLSFTTSTAPISPRAPRSPWHPGGLHLVGVGVRPRRGADATIQPALSAPARGRIHLADAGHPRPGAAHHHLHRFAAAAPADERDPSGDRRAWDQRGRLPGRNLPRRIMAVPLGQSEAARAIGLSKMQGMRLVILPQALRIVIPPLGNAFNGLMKTSSLARSSPWVNSCGGPRC